MVFNYLLGEVNQTDCITENQQIRSVVVCLNRRTCIIMNEQIQTPKRFQSILISNSYTAADERTEWFTVVTDNKGYRG